MSEAASLLSERTIYYAAFNYASGLMTPRLTSSWLIRTRLGILIQLPIQLLIMLITTVPCLLMELALGQYSSKTILKVWDLCPILRGTGYCSFIFFLIYQMYYNVLCSHTLSFTLLSLKATPEWKSCNNSWNTANCSTRISSVEEFYLNHILNIDRDSGNFGLPEHQLLRYSMGTILLIFLANASGSKFFEKTLTILAVIPTIQILIMLVSPIIYSGFGNLDVLFTDLGHLEELKNINTWIVFLNTANSASGLGFGAFITLATKSSFRNPIHFKSILISFLIVLNVICYNITVQYFLLPLSMHYNKSLDDFLELEDNLKLPESVFFFPEANRFWVTMWMSNKYLLGLRSMIVMMFLNVETLHNVIPKVGKHHSLTVFIMCAVIYHGAMLFSTKAGLLVINIVDHAVYHYVLPFLNTIQLIGVIFIYGITNFRDDIQFMLGIKLSSYWTVVCLLNPIFFSVIFIIRVIKLYTKNNLYHFVWLYLVQQSILWFSLALIVVYALCYLIKIVVKKESQIWGPKDPTLKRSREIFGAEPDLAQEFIYRQEKFQFDE